MMVRSIVAALVIAMLLPLAAYADCGSCKSKCNSCVKSTCNKCESKCNSCAKPCCKKTSCNKCSKCSPCEHKCNSCVKSTCGSCNKCSKPKCNSCAKPCCKKTTCNSCNKCSKPKCNSCAKPCCAKKSCNSCSKCSKPACGECKKACACMDWHPYCGCEMIDSLCIQASTCGCDGDSAGPLKLELHDNMGKTIATVQLDGPIENGSSWNYKFAEPIKADSIREAVIVNDTDDSATLTWFSVTGMGECGWSYNYFDHKCSGVVIGKDGCPRFVLF